MAGVAKTKAIRLPVCVYRFVVIPAKAGIQEGDAGERGDGRFYQMAHWAVMPVIVIPAQAGMDYINHWIPAFAGMTARGFTLSPGGYRPPRPLVLDAVPPRLG